MGKKRRKSSRKGKGNAKARRAKFLGAINERIWGRAKELLRMGHKVDTDPQIKRLRKARIKAEKL